MADAEARERAVALRGYAARSTGYIYADECAVLVAAADDLDALAASEARVAALEQREKEVVGALRGMLELDDYRPRDGSVNPEWETEILSGARAVLEDTLPCGHPESSLTSADSLTFCAECAVLSARPTEETP